MTRSPAASRPARTLGRLIVPFAAEASSRGRSSGSRTWLMTTSPIGSRAARSSATASTVSWTGISSSSVTTWTAVCGEVSI